MVSGQSVWLEEHCLDYLCRQLVVQCHTVSTEVTVCYLSYLADLKNTYFFLMFHSKLLLTAVILLSFSQMLQEKYENAAGDNKKIKTTAEGRIPNLK